MVSSLVQCSQENIFNIINPIIEWGLTNFARSVSFSDTAPLISCVYVIPTVDCIERFARMFTGFFSLNFFL